MLAGHIAAVEPLAHESVTARDLTKALESYRTARDVLTSAEFDVGADSGAAAARTARRAVVDAEELVARVAAAVGAPVADGAGADDYRQALGDLTHAAPGDDLEAIAGRVRCVRARLAGGAAPTAGVPA